MSDALNELRSHLLLPSDLLDVARLRNPELEIDLPERNGRVVLRVRTARGEVIYRRDPAERWADTFGRSGLLGGGA